MKASNQGVLKTVMLFVGAGALLSAIPVHASMKEIKTYKEAFPDTKLKCVDCHKDGKPSKEAAALNEYGEAVVKAVEKADEKPTADTYTKVGKIEDFKPAE